MSEPRTTEKTTASDRPPKWRRTLLLGAAVVASVLMLNVIILAWSASTAGEYSANATIFTGPCEKSQNIVNWSMLLINLLSTILMAVSFNAVQILLSPTRTEVDWAHEIGAWLHVGAPMSWSNFLAASSLRRGLIALLVLTSLPLHWMYNSVIFLNSASNAYTVTAVTPEFLPPTYGAYNDLNALSFGWAESPAPDAKWGESVQWMQHNVDKLANLSNHDCVQAYGSGFYQSTWGNVLLVTDAKPGFTVAPGVGSDIPNSTVIMALEYFPAPHRLGGDSDLSWLCGDFMDETCSFSEALKYSSEWRLESMYFGFGKNKPDSASVKYCLAEKRMAPCSAHIAGPLLTIVVIFNVIQLACLVVILSWMSGFKPLVLVGDAITSFLQQPDGATSAPEKAKTKGQETKGHWFFAGILFLGSLVTGLVFLVKSLKAPSQSPNGWYPVEYWTATHWFPSNGLDTGLTRFHISMATSSSVLGSLLLINLPQLLLSADLFIYKYILILIVAAAEVSKFAIQRAGLRVSSPVKGTHQHSTYYLHLPLHYSIPFLVLSAFLHWALSRSFFLVRSDIYSPSGTIIPSTSGRLMGGYNAISILIAFILGVVLIVGLIVIAIILRHSRKGVPSLDSCSLKFSAACHPPDGDDDVAEKEVVYGIPKSDLNSNPPLALEGEAEMQEQGQGRAYVFTSREVCPLK